MPLVHISTDYVFEGSGPRPWREDDPVAPQNVYGRTKLAGEAAVRARLAEHLILRTSWVFAAHGHNFVKTMLRLAAERDEIPVVDDQHGCPTSAQDLAAMVAHLVTNDLHGTYHVTNQGRTTWFGLARDTLQAGGYDPGKLRAIRTAELQPPRPAPRPAFSVLDNTALRLSGVPLLPHYRESFERLVKEVLT